jgi:hypothetical protein
VAIRYLFGFDNTPTCGSKTGRIDPVLIASWSKFAAQNRSSRFVELLSSLVTNINQQNQIITQKDPPLFERAGIVKEFDDG